MRRWLPGCFVVLVAASLFTSTASFAVGPGGRADGTGTVESTVRDINKTQQTVYLMNGTLLWTNDTKLLDELAPGAHVRAAFEDRGGRKFINRLEVLPSQ